MRFGLGYIQLPFKLGILGPFAHGRLQNLKISEVTFAHVITPLIKWQGSN